MAGSLSWRNGEGKSRPSINRKSGAGGAIGGPRMCDHVGYAVRTVNPQTAMERMARAGQPRVAVRTTNPSWRWNPRTDRLVPTGHPTKACVRIAGNRSAAANPCRVRCAYHESVAVTPTLKRVAWCPQGTQQKKVEVLRPPPFKSARIESTRCRDQAATSCGYWISNPLTTELRNPPVAAFEFV
jgi:hypothetical protein